VTPKIWMPSLAASSVPAGVTMPPPSPASDVGESVVTTSLVGLVSVLASPASGLFELSPLQWSSVLPPRAISIADTRM
jgi:hypothetical protein